MLDYEIRNILILAVQVPFTRGGAEVLVDNLKRELCARGFCADIVQLPFSAQPKTNILREIATWRSLLLTEYAGKKVDLVISTKFPSYIAPHPRKVVWLIHQLRQLYELYGTRFSDFDINDEDEAVRRMVYQADIRALKECNRVFTISQNVSSRLERYMGIASTPLPPPPPLLGSYRRESKGDYILSVGRICSAKRVDLIVRSLPQIDRGLKLKIVGLADEPAMNSYLRSIVDQHHLWDRIEFLGRVEESELLSLYANAFAVYYAPYDEDYGFVSLEALASRVPVVTATDSGCVLEFIRHEENGLVVEPNEQSIAQAFNRLFQDQTLYTSLVQKMSDNVSFMDWDTIIAQLTDSNIPISPPLP